jgi:hypothetical protein
MLLAVGFTIGLAGTAGARPWDHDHSAAPTHGLRPEIANRIQVDGRADRAQEHVSRPEPSARPQARPDNNVGQAKHFALPLKSDIAMKARPGDDRESGAAKSPTAKPVDQSNAVDNSFGRVKSHFALPLKRDIALKARPGDDREDSRPTGAMASTKDAHAEKILGKHGITFNSAARPTSASDKLSLCRHTGVCLPSASGSDDTEDKTE